MDYRIDHNQIKTTVKDFSLEDTLTCGQCFRWEKQEDGSFLGIVGDHVQRVWQKGEELIFDQCSEEDFRSLWAVYFDLSTDYCQIQNNLCDDKTLEQAIRHAGGIRILRQDPWETICSFIISQNNNIPRIKGIISRLCQQFGEVLPSGGYRFPSAEKLASLKIEDLAPIRAGFRGKYLLDAAKKVVSGEVNFERIYAGSLTDGEEELRKIYGIGKKVAQCVLLYGFYRTEAFPVDVWIKKVLKEYYPDGFPYLDQPYAGIAQQYLFHYIRLLEKGKIPEE